MVCSKFFWASMSELDTSVLNVKCCLYRTYVRLYIAAGTASLAGHSYRAKLLPPRVPIALPHSISSIEQVCPTVRPCFWAKEPSHCTAYALLPCSRLPHMFYVHLAHQEISASASSQHNLYMYLQTR